MTNWPGCDKLKTGIITGLLGYHNENIGLSVAAAAYINGYAGDLAADKYTKISMISSDTVSMIPEVFKMAEKCIQNEIFGDVLVSNYLSAKAIELFELFGCDEFAKIRLLAIEIAKKCSFNLSGFLDDIDGHVRNFAISTQLENE